jgi:hypothetical protein
MTDWATRVSTREIREMEAPQSDLDVEATIAAIRKLVEDNEELLPADVGPVVDESVAAPAPADVAALTPAPRPDDAELPARQFCSATLLPALIPADDLPDEPRRGLLTVLRRWLH